MDRKYPVVVIIDDSKAFRIFSRDVIKRTTKWVRIFDAKDGIEGLKLYKQHKPDLILLDLNMPKLDGSKVLEVIMKDDFNSRVIMTTAYDDDQETINRLFKLGAYSFVPKPMNRMTLMKTISDALYNGKIAGTHNQISKSFVLNQNYS